MAAPLTVVLAVAGCSGSGTGGTAAPTGPASADNRPLRGGGTLTVGLSADPDALDPTTSSTLVGREVFTSICEKLYDIDGTATIVPELAAALPQLADGGRTVTIKLRTGLKFNDGTAMDAAAVKTSLERDLTLPTSTRASELSAVSAVAVVDPATVRLTLKRPYAPITATLADRAGMVMSPTALAAEGVNFGAKPVCVGPFTLANRVSGSVITVRKSPYYYDRAKVRLDGIDYKIITDANVRAANLKSGDIDVGEEMATSDIASLQATKGMRVLAGGGLGYNGITINVANAGGSTAPPGAVHTPLAEHPELRQAFELSLDRDAINKVVFNGLYKPDCSPLPLDSRYRAKTSCPGHDVTKAKQLVARSGVKTPVPVTMSVDADPVAERLAQLIQGLAKDAGFAVKVVPQEFVTQLAQAKAGNFDTTLVGWSGRVDPDGNLTNLITSRGALNYGAVHDPAIDSAIQQAAATTDTARRTALYAQAIARQAQLDGVIYLYHNLYYLAAAGKVGGIRYWADGLPRFGTAGFVK
jgi:peptide/nickel transport system substrate-binding protein